MWPERGITYLDFYAVFYILNFHHCHVVSINHSYLTCCNNHIKYIHWGIWRMKRHNILKKIKHNTTYWLYMCVYLEFILFSCILINKSIIWLMNKCYLSMLIYLLQYICLCYDHSVTAHFRSHLKFYLSKSQRRKCKMWRNVWFHCDST